MLNPYEAIAFAEFLTHGPDPIDKHPVVTRRPFAIRLARQSRLAWVRLHRRVRRLEAGPRPAMAQCACACAC